MNQALPNSAAARDARYVLHGMSHLSTLRKAGPIVMTGGKGIFIIDENGTPYLEAVAGMWCTALGFSDHELVEAAVEQMRKLPYYYTVAHRSVQPSVELAERLAEIVPIQNPRFYFCLSGSEANDNLVKFIWYRNNIIGKPQKKKIIGRHNAYHGATVAASSLTGIPANHRAFDLPIHNILHTGEASFYHHGLPGETEDEFAQRRADELEALILAEGPETVAAFIAEPVTGGGGVIVPPATYHARIQAVLDRYDVMMLDDEVITGFLRTGNMWGAETVGMTPTTMTLAKQITSAYQPLAALVMPPEMYDALEQGSDEIGTFAHGSTYSGHPVACAVAVKMLDIIKSRNLEAHVAGVAARFAQRMNVFRDHPLVGEVRHAGLMGAIEFTADKATKAPFEPKGMFGRLLKDRAQEEYRLIIRTPGSGDCAGFSPPLIITEDEVDDLFDRFTGALNDVTDAYVRMGAKVG
ncbi:aminotransferase [Zavarzinia sp. CC-PAN008]|uniref:aminotransferase n=1 Tax=Zavarzinia sp. CC-PAN008 TaxID=3243332 RepID=UPI003F7470DF